MSNDNQNNQLFEEQRQDIKDIKRKQGYEAGFNLTMRSEIAENFSMLYIQNQRHLNMIQNKAEFHFVVMIILNYLLSVKQLSFFISLVSDQNIIKFINLFFQG